ncbi:hypothetical protein Q1695_003697 [Nippostrongylus brasiliensis]|nr:hypothetical protein Q1695_003697 [Nippostrongylus brasiliensis]
MAEASADELSSPFLTRMLGKLQVLSTNLKCTKQQNGRFLYEYSIQVHPEKEDKDLAGLLYPNTASGLSTTDGSSYTSSSYAKSEQQQSTSSSVKRSSHSDLGCTYMVNVRFILFHRNINGKAQSMTKSEFPSSASVRTVVEHFRTETAAERNGVFAPRLAYSIGRDYQNTFPLSDSDLDKCLSDLIGDNDVNSLSIIADIC